MTKSKAFLYLTTIGRRTGRPRTIEIWFVEVDGRFYVVSELKERSNWVRNLRRDTWVIFSIGTAGDRHAERRACGARARVVPVESEPALVGRVRSCMDRKYGWSDGLVVEIAPCPETFG